jgi:hypothetical protein
MRSFILLNFASLALGTAAFAQENVIYTMNEECRMGWVWSCAVEITQGSWGGGDPRYSVEHNLPGCEAKAKYSREMFKKCNARASVPSPEAIAKLTEVLEQRTSEKIGKLLDSQSKEFLELLSAIAEINKEKGK